MSVKYYLKIALNNFLRKKINIINVSLLVLSMSLFIFTSSFSKTFSNIMERQKEGNINYRLLLVNNLEKSFNKNDFKNIEHIEFVSSNDEYTRVVQVGEKELYLIGVPDNYITTIYGKTIDSSSNKHTLICPSKFYLNDNSQKIDKRVLKRGIDILNNNVEINSLNYKESYQIIGIFDVNKYTSGDYNICFTSRSNIKEICAMEKLIQQQECEKNNDFCFENNDDSSGVILIDKIENVEFVANKVSDLGYFTTLVSEYNDEGIKFINQVLFVIVLIVMIITFIVLAISNNKFVQYNKKNNLIFKALGYNDKILIKINYLETIISLIVSFLITTIVTIILYIILINIFSSDIDLGYSINISYLSFLISFVFMLFISLFSNYIALKNNDNSIVKEISDNEI